FHLFSDLWNLFTASADPISPVYLAFLPLILRSFKKTSFSMKLIYLYSFLALIVWYVTPRTGGGRFILPYLPAFSVLAIFPLQFVEKKITAFFYSFIVIVSVISILYRAGANAKFIPVILGQETTGQFLTTHLHFSFGDFYDTDGFFAHHVKTDDLVLVDGFHNLYYAHFPYTFDANNKQITYLAVQGRNLLPKQFANWKLIHTNQLTHVFVYEK
ncbi:MAG: hypothetical protein KGL95_15930, partial [Patescibacteria group bacterium]|nr:hypothetical protein [Patescibacteria group bacterium]